MVRWVVGSIPHDRLTELFLVSVILSMGRKEGNVLFNEAFNTFYLQLYGVGHMVKNHTQCERKPAAATTWATLSDKQQWFFTIPQT